ncbi:hypothetical protein VTO73DRAFT_7145 [Trametes versicolor]
MRADRVFDTPSVTSTLALACFTLTSFTARCRLRAFRSPSVSSTLAFERLAPTGPPHAVGQRNRIPKAQQQCAARPTLHCPPPPPPSPLCPSSALLNPMQRPPHPSDKNHLCNCAKHAPHRVGPDTFLSSIPARAAPPPSTAPPSGPGAAAPRIPPSQPAKRPRLAAAPLPGRQPSSPAASSPRTAAQSPPHGREATASPPLRPPSLSASPPLPPDNASDPDADEELPEEGDVPPVARLRELQIAEEFITAIRNATLNESHLPAETIDRLRAPSHEPRTVNRLERAALRMFLARGDASEENYADNREAIVELDHANKDIPTYEQLKTLVADLTGIHALREDMCPNTCIAYTGPFADLVKCPMCSEPRYDVVQTARTRKNVARRTFHTFPLGPQVQAMYSSPENAEHMGYRAAITRELLGQDPDDFQILEDLSSIYIHHWPPRGDAFARIQSAAPFVFSLAARHDAAIIWLLYAPRLTHNHEPRRDAQERQELQFCAPNQRVEDLAELHEQTLGSICKVEVSQGESPRTLDVDLRSVQR